MFGRKPKPLIPRVEVLNLKPGDALVFTSEHRLPAEVYYKLKAAVNDQYPGIKVLVLDDGLNLKVIQHGGEQPND